MRSLFSFVTGFIAAILAGDILLSTDLVLAGEGVALISKIQLAGDGQIFVIAGTRKPFDKIDNSTVAYPNPKAF